MHNLRHGIKSYLLLSLKVYPSRNKTAGVWREIWCILVMNFHDGFFWKRISRFLENISFSCLSVDGGERTRLIGLFSNFKKVKAHFPLLMKRQGAALFEKLKTWTLMFWNYCSENSSVSSEQLWLSGRASDWEPEVPGSNSVHGKSPNYSFSSVLLSVYLC